MRELTEIETEAVAGGFDTVAFALGVALTVELLAIMMT